MMADHFHELRVALGLALAIDKWNGRELSGFVSSPDPAFWIRQGPLVTPRLHVAFP
jgi:hypothetical protein